MTKLFTKNSKILASGNSETVVYNYGIPAQRTCPLAGTCKQGCYAAQGAYVWPVVKAAYEYRLAESLKEDWSAFDAELKRLVKSAKGKQVVIRIHDSGDFYSACYLRKWLALVSRFPDVVFYCYTKMVPLFKRWPEPLPRNLTVIFSEGGLADRLINQDVDRHSRVFESLDALLAAGYVDTTVNDLNALSPNHKIGLVYHGAKSKFFKTA